MYPCVYLHMCVYCLCGLQKCSDSCGTFGTEPPRRRAGQLRVSLPKARQSPGPPTTSPSFYRPLMDKSPTAFLKSIQTISFCSIALSETARPKELLQNPLRMRARLCPSVAWHFPKQLAPLSFLLLEPRLQLQAPARRRMWSATAGPGSPKEVILPGKNRV